MVLRTLLLAVAVIQLATCRHRSEPLTNVQATSGQVTAARNITDATAREKRLVGVYSASAYSAINRFMTSRVIFNANSSRIELQYDVKELTDTQKSWLSYVNELKAILASYSENSSGEQAKGVINANADAQRFRSEGRIPLYRGIKKFDGRAFKRLTVEGNLILNRDFMSTTEDLDTATNFALVDANSDTGGADPKRAVILEVEAIAATPVDSISLVPGEKEWIISPGRVFKVAEVGEITTKYKHQIYNDQRGDYENVEEEFTFPRIRLAEIDQEQLFADPSGPDFQKLKAEMAESNAGRTGVEFSALALPPADPAQVSCTAGIANSVSECMANQACAYQKGDMAVPEAALEEDAFSACIDQTIKIIDSTCKSDQRCEEDFIKVSGDPFDWNGRKFVANAKGNSNSGQQVAGVDLAKPVYGAVVASFKSQNEAIDFIAKNQKCLAGGYGIYDSAVFNKITTGYFAVLVPTNSKADAQKLLGDAKSCDQQRLGQAYLKLVKD